MVVAPSCSLSLLGTHQQNFGFSNSDAVIDVMVFFEYSSASSRCFVKD